MNIVIGLLVAGAVGGFSPWSIYEVGYWSVSIPLAVFLGYMFGKESS